MARSFIFINYHQALRFGHVAWGFALSQGNQYCWGSSDHLLRQPMTNLIALAKYSHVPPGGDIDFWCEQGSFERMLESMSQGHHIQYQQNQYQQNQHHQEQQLQNQHQELRYHINYHAYKELHHDDQQNCDAERALQELEVIKAGGWSLLANNCIDQTYRVLDAYGAGSALVDPKLRYRVMNRKDRLSTMLPRKWFAAALGESRSLDGNKLGATRTGCVQGVGLRPQGLQEIKGGKS